jgi:hypothetical protein
VPRRNLIGNRLGSFCEISGNIEYCFLEDLYKIVINLCGFSKVGGFGCQITKKSGFSGGMRVFVGLQIFGSEKFFV